MEQAKQAMNDQAQGRFNIEIVDKLQRNLEISSTRAERYHVYHQGLPQGEWAKFVNFLKSVYRLGLENHWPRRSHCRARQSAVHQFFSSRESCILEMRMKNEK